MTDPAAPADSPGADACADPRIEAAVFRRLLAHLDARKDVQNIDLMNLAGFCRNCLAKWYVEEAGKQGSRVDIDAMKTRVYGMPYAEWKAKYQK
ncbi:MAG: DUF1244 domain-containing protein [Gammaproteobacteria bacterium]